MTVEKKSSKIFKVVLKFGIRSGYSGAGMAKVLWARLSQFC